MSNINISTREIITIKGAIMLYTNNFAEYRAILKNKFLPATPLTESVIKNLIEGMHVKNTKLFFKGLIPSNCRYVSAYPDPHIMWTVPEGIKPLVHTQKKYNGDYYYPNIFFNLIGNELSVYSYKKWKGLDTKLYACNLPNSYADGKFCWGTAEMDVESCETWEEVMAMGYNKLFNSKFSHILKVSSLGNQKDAKSFDYKIFKKHIDKVDGLL